MSDIDFDELDKAVNNLMKDASVGKTDDAENNTPVGVIDNSPEDTKPMTVQTDDVALSARESVAVTATPAAPAQTGPTATKPIVTRRRGQFMDIVAPQSSQKPAAPIRREAMTIKPTTENIVFDTPEPVSSSTNLAFENGESNFVSAEPVEITGNDDQPMPDPIDFQKKLDPENDVPESGNIEEPVDAKPSDTAELPLTSPFLPDAKVEKRPLGGAAPLTLENLGPELELEKNEQSTAMPAELHPELAVLESEDTSTIAGQDAPSSSPAEASKARETTINETVESAPNPEQKSASASLPSAENTPEDVLTKASASIPQQYEEKQSESQSSAGSIYDTQEYHQPLQHPEKKKSSIVIIVLILTCILLGAAAAALYYYFSMQ